MKNDTKKVVRDAIRQLSVRVDKEYTARKLKDPQFIQLYYDNNRACWTIVIPGLPLSDLPVAFTDEWIESLGKRQQRLVLDTLEDMRWLPSPM